jgi:ATP-dependent exoDNAse (exonuclease V) beta subunit
MKLTATQQQALDIDRNVFIEAGAGSGKTTIMIERFFKLLSAHPDLDPQNILVITFTKLAAIELKERVQNRLTSKNHSLSPQREQQLLSTLHHLSFSTIDGFCAATLRDMPLLANIDPQFTVLSAEESSLRRDDAIEETLRELAHQPNPHYQQLLLTYSKSQIKRLLQSLLNSQAGALNIKERQEALYQRAREACQSADDQRVTAHVITCTESLLVIKDKADQAYCHNKYQDGTLDYYDLLTKTHDILTHHDALRHLQQRYRYIFVDEFQDTNTLQWQLVQRLCGSFDPLSSKKLCIVGDIKQSIYRFRGAEPHLFNTLLTTKYPEHETHIVHLSDNFRSTPEVIQFINNLFLPLLSQGDHAIPYTPLNAHRVSTGGSVTTSFLSSDQSLTDECEVLQHWLLDQHQSGKKWNDIAILSRKRASLTTLFHHLKRHDIPVLLHGESDYFQRQHCIDIITFAKMVLNPYDTVTLSGLLLSPLFKLTYDDLYLLTQSEAGVYSTLLSVTTQQFPLLWETLNEESQNRIQCAAHSVIKWIDHSRYYPLYTTVLDMVYETQYYDSNEIAYLIDQIQTLEAITPSRASLWEQLSRLPYQTSHYTSKTNDDHNGVNLMTIHQSKGLEFEAVAIMCCHSQFNVSKSDPLIVTNHGVAVSLAATKEGTNYLKAQLIQHLIPEVIAEEKRLFYVGCTRAISTLFLSGILPSYPITETPRCFIDFMREHAAINPHGLLLNTIQYPSFQANALAQMPLFSTKSETISNTISKTIANDHLSSQPSQDISPRSPSIHPIPFSVGDIELLLSCPKKYQQRSLLQTVQSQGKESIDSHQMTAIRRGLIHHHAAAYWIRQGCDPETAITAALAHWAPSGGHDGESDELQTELHDTLSALSEYNLDNNDKATTLTEWPFTVSVSPDYIISGRIDLVSITDQGITIIDIKTDQIDRSSLKIRASQYHTQLCLYVMAVAEYRHQPPTAITCRLYFTQCHAWETVTITLSDIDTLKKNIQQALRNNDEIYFNPEQVVCDACPIYRINPSCRH